MTGMTHDMNLRSNPRLFIFYFILVGIPLGAFMLYPQLPPLAGSLVIGASLFVDYKLFRFAQPYIKTKIVTGDEAVTVFLAGQEESFPWREITLSGKFYFQKAAKPFIFLYHLGKDRIITIPYEYRDMNILEQTLMEKTPFEVFPPGIDIRGVIIERYHSGKDRPGEQESEGGD